MRPLQQSEMTKSLMVKGKKEKEGYSSVTLANRRLPFQWPYMNPTIKLGQLLMVLGFRDEAVLGATRTLTAAQGAGNEAAEDKDQAIIYEDVYFIPLAGGILLHLD